MSFTLNYTAIRKECADFAGLTDDSTNWSTADTARLDRAMEAGYRRFIFNPPPVNGNEKHEWRFLYTTATLNLVASTESYDLPSDFVQMTEIFTFNTEQDVPVGPIEETGAVDVRNMKAQPGGQDTNRPSCFYVDNTAGANGKVFFWPIPDAAYALTYGYRKAPGDFNSTTDLDPAFSEPEYTECLRLSCLVATSKIYPFGIDFEPDFREALFSAIELDKRRYSHPRHYIGTLKFDENARSNVSQNKITVSHEDSP